jgi:phosphoribosylamine--glycine ligase
MNILVIGGGGREHALAWKLAEPAHVDRVFVAPGNAGTERDAKLQNVAIDPMDFAALAEFADTNACQLTVVGPEAPLVGGIVDYFTERGLPCFGPTRGAAQLEGSKSFTKDFLARHAILRPTTRPSRMSILRWPTCRQGSADCHQGRWPRGGQRGDCGDGSWRQPRTLVRDMLSEQSPSAKRRHRVVIEDYLEGEEASFIVMVDGKTALPMATSQDHKRVGDGDTGPNTGGMGAYSPAPVVTEAVHQRIMREVIEPTVAGMAKEGLPYTGFLYAGLMITADGTPRVIEYNCRFGDPETQPIMLRMQSDLDVLCSAALEGRLDQYSADWDPRPALGVVLAAGGYPGSYSKGAVISGLSTADSEAVKVFHAGTSSDADGNVLTAGGRVLCVTALGADIQAAQAAAYESVAQIEWDNMLYRRDIGWRAMNR